MSKFILACLLIGLFLKIIWVDGMNWLLRRTRIE